MLYKRFLCKFGNKLEVDKMKKAYEHKNDIQKLFGKYDLYRVLSIINAADDIDRTVLIF